MTRPLGFKTRVRLPDALPEPPRIEADNGGRRRLLWLGGAAWLLATLGGMWLHWGWFGEGVTRRPRAPRALAPAPEPAANSAHASAATAPDPAPPDTAADSPELPECETLLPKLGSAITESSGLPRDLTASGYGALVDQTYAQRAFGHCAARPLQLDLCVILQGGGPVAMTAKTRPPDADAERCIRAAIEALPYRYHEAPFLLRSRPWLVPER